MVQAPIEITTIRLRLSPFTSEDRMDVFEYARNPKIAETVTWHAHQTPEDSQAFLDYVIGRMNLHPGKLFLPFAIRKGGNAIGSLCFSQYSPIGGQLDYALSVDHWNQGLMSEATTALAHWLFEQVPDLLRIQASCLVANTGSRRVMEKMGMAFEGITRSAILVKGRPVDLAVHSVLRADLMAEAP